MDKLSKLNWLAIGILTVVSMGISMAWYSALTEPWLEAVGITMEDAENTDPTAYFIAILSGIATFTLMAYLFRRMHIVTASKGIQMAALFFLGFIAFSMMTTNMFSLRPFALTLIDGGDIFIQYLVGGAVLGAWQKGETISEAAKDIAEEIR